MKVNRPREEPLNLPLAEELEDLARQRIDTFCSRHCGEMADWLQGQLSSDLEYAGQLRRVWGCSSFVFESALLDPAGFRDLCESGDLFTSYPKEGHRARLASALAHHNTDSESKLHQVLRQFRRREMSRIVWRDFTRSVDLLETTGDVTRLAEACIQHSLEVLYPLLAAEWGTPMGRASGEPQQMVVLGMGKMGAWELNVSSDIDLIFTYSEGGDTQGGRRQLSNQEFFVRLGQKLIQALDNQTVDGFVFRVDMRLRPYGESGSLVLNFDAMEEYYQTQGRDWERYAMIKARVVAGREEDGRKLMAVLRAFTYRRYIDFSAIQSLRDMKALINRERVRTAADNDIKKGPGGIREVEFIVQAFQLIRGGKDAQFQNPALKEVLEAIATAALLPGDMVQNLWAAYVFLRDTEHALQGSEDRQTQTLPKDDASRLRLANILGFEDWPAFARQLQQHRDLVAEVFADIAAEPKDERRELPQQFAAARRLWFETSDEGSVCEELTSLGLADTDHGAAALVALRSSRALEALSPSVRERVDNFVPLLLTACAEHDNGALALERILPLLEGILRRSAYLVLLIENPQALRQLVHLCGESLWIAEQIAQYPALLDELLDSRTLYRAADKQSIAQELRIHMLRVPGDDLEAQMEALRYFRRAQALRIAACEVEGVLPLMQVSDNLTWLAEVILDQVLVLAWEWTVARHGIPGRAEGSSEPSLLVVGYGKLGGIELGHGSDLDLVFLYDADPSFNTDGMRPVDNATFFARLCQRMIHILATQTAGGLLYEVDTRLRPNGNSGMLVTTLSAFDKYQKESAWSWEHQALVRARVVTAKGHLAPRFEAVRREVLCLPRDRRQLQGEVVAMRDKMREHLGSSSEEQKRGQFHLKQDPGGIVDIEFMVQFAVLAGASAIPDLTRWTDNMRILDSLEEHQILSEEEASALREAYIVYRSNVHRLQLQKSQTKVPGEVFAHHRQAVRAVFRRLLAT